MDLRYKKVPIEAQILEHLCEHSTPGIEVTKGTKRGSNPEITII